MNDNPRHFEESDYPALLAEAMKGSYDGLTDSFLLIIFKRMGWRWTGWRDPSKNGPEEVIYRAFDRLKAEIEWQVTLDGKPTGTRGTHDQCWVAIHKASSGASVDWQRRYEGWDIVPVLRNSNATKPEPGPVVDAVPGTTK